MLSDNVIEPRLRHAPRSGERRSQSRQSRWGCAHAGQSLSVHALQLEAPALRATLAFGLGEACHAHYGGLFCHGDGMLQQAYAYCHYRSLKRIRQSPIAGLCSHWRSSALTGRDAARLEAVAAECRKLGAEVTTALLSVTEREAMAQFLESLGPVDLAIANAGISAGTGAHGGESAEQAQRILAINVDGVLNTIHPLIPRMKVSSGQGAACYYFLTAAFRGMPGAPAYSASKGAVRMYGEALRPELAEHGVGVTVICPGFVRTPMTDVNNFPYAVFDGSG